MSQLYYTPPAEEIFDEVKREAISIWNTYDNTYNYATDKINRIKDIKNVQDNFMYIVAMFDLDNQKRLAMKLSEQACKEIRLRMIDGGQPLEFIFF